MFSLHLKRGAKATPGWCRMSAYPLLNSNIFAWLICSKPGSWQEICVQVDRTLCVFDGVSVEHQNDFFMFLEWMVEVASLKMRYRPSQRHIKWDVVFGLDNGCGHELHLSYPPTFLYQHMHIPCSYIRSKLSSKIHDSNTSRKQPNKCDPKTVPPWV